MNAATSRALRLTGNLESCPNGPFIKSRTNPQEPEFSWTLETAVLSESSRSIGTAIQALDRKGGFKLFALPGIDHIDSDHELDDTNRRRLHLIQHAARLNGWAAYIVRVRAADKERRQNDSTTLSAQLDDDDSGFLRHLKATEEAGNCEFQIKSVSDLDGTEVIPPYDETGKESRLRFQSSHRFLQPDFLQPHHLDEPVEQERGGHTIPRRKTWSRDAVLLIPRTQVWGLLARTIRPFFLPSDGRATPLGSGPKCHCDDNALRTLASHFLSKALDFWNRGERDTVHTENACAIATVVSIAQPSSPDDIDKSLLVSALTFSDLYNEGWLFGFVCEWGGVHDTSTSLATAVRGLAPFLTDAPAGLLEAYAVESLNEFLAPVEDFASRLEVVKSFPQDLLPCNFTTAPLERDALTLVLGVTNLFGTTIDLEVEEAARGLLWTYQHGEALADAIVAYGSGSKYARNVLKGSARLGDGEHLPSLNPLVMGFIARLGQKPEGESADEEFARRTLQAKVLKRLTELVRDFVGVTVSTGVVEDAGNLMDPHHLTLFLSTVASFPGKEVFNSLLCLTVGRHPSSAEVENFRECWLPFWSSLVNMDGVPLDACVFAFCNHQEAYIEKLRLGSGQQGRYLEMRSAASPNGLGASESPSAASNTLEEKIYDWLTDPNAPVGLTATSTFCRLQKYHGLHGEYLSSRVTPIPGTDKGQLLMVKRRPDRVGRGRDPDKMLEPMIRAEVEWRLFTRFRPMLPWISHWYAKLTGHSQPTDCGASSLSAAYLEGWDVPPGDVLELPGDPESEVEDEAAVPAVKSERPAEVELEDFAEQRPRSIKRRASSVEGSSSRGPQTEIRIKRERLEY